MAATAKAAFITIIVTVKTSGALSNSFAISFVASTIVFKC